MSIETNDDSVKVQIANLAATVGDHEKRLRILERITYAVVGVWAFLQGIPTLLDSVATLVHK